MLWQIFILCLKGCMNSDVYSINVSLVCVQLYGSPVSAS